MYLEKKSWLHHKLIRIPNPGVEPVACCTPQGWRWPLRRSPAPWGHPIHKEGLNAGWNGEAELGWSRGDGEKKAILWTEYSKRHGFRDTKVPCRYIYWEKKKHLVHSTPSVWTGRVWKEKAMKGEIMQRKKGEGVTLCVYEIRVMKPSKRLRMEITRSQIDGNTGILAWRQAKGEIEQTQFLTKIVQMVVNER